VKENDGLDRTVCVAPMLDWTDRHCRYFLRLISQHAVLYSEMVTTGAILHGDRDRHLLFNDEEQPLALQLGGSDPDALTECAKIAEDYGYNEINLNVGCPSDRVQSGRFGVCLMNEPELVAGCVHSMQSAVSIPVTVKSRIGVDDNDSYEALSKFVEITSLAGCRTFIIHARKAWLKGLSPKENREIPPLCYEMVQRVKEDFPELGIIINGGVDSLMKITEQLVRVDGVMIGREAYHNPWILSELDALFYGGMDSKQSRHEVIERFLPYAESQLRKGVRLHSMTRHLLGLFHGEPGARAWRRYLSENANKEDAGLEVLVNALALVGK
jgi:tRNA-dihydrouridine synthase A